MSAARCGWRTWLYSQVYSTKHYLSCPIYLTTNAERESNPKYYFGDNGILALFLADRDPALLENQVAVLLHQRHGDGVYFLKSARTGIDIDFYIPQERTAIQVTYSLTDSSFQRETASLAALAKAQPEVERLMVVTYEEEACVEVSGAKIEVVPAYRFLLEY